MPKGVRVHPFGVPRKKADICRHTPKGTRYTNVSLGQALASGAHPRRIELFESLSRTK